MKDNVTGSPQCVLHVNRNIKHETKITGGIRESWENEIKVIKTMTDTETVHCFTWEVMLCFIPILQVRK